jgi:hypothetical protein
MFISSETKKYIDRVPGRSEDVIEFEAHFEDMSAPNRFATKTSETVTSSI